MVRVEIRSRSERGYRVLGLSRLFGLEFEEIEITDEQLAELEAEPAQFVEFRVAGKLNTGRQDVSDAVTAEQPQGKRK